MKDHYTLLDNNLVREHVIRNTRKKVERLVAQSSTPHVFIATDKGELLQIVGSEENKLFFVKKELIH